MSRKSALSASFLGIAAASAAALLLLSLRAGAESEVPEPAKPPPFDKAPFSDERTAVPSPAEWQAAAPVTLDPMGHAPAACSAKRVREWVQLMCAAGSIGGVRMLGGKKDGLQVRFHKVDPDFGLAEKVELAFPVRRGDQRVIEVIIVELGYRSASSVSPFFVLSELWPEGEESPEIAIH